MKKHPQRSTYLSGFLLLFGFYHLGLEAPISPEDLVICDPKLVAHSHFLGGPHQPVSLLCPSKPNSPGDPIIIHVPFLSLRGLIEGEKEISLVLGQPHSVH